MTPLISVAAVGIIKTATIEVDMRSRRRWDTESKKAILAKVEIDAKQPGMDTNKAIKQNEISSTQYYSWRKSLGGGMVKPKRQRLAPKLIEIPQTEPRSKLVAVMGSVEDISTLMRSLS